MKSFARIQPVGERAVQFYLPLPLQADYPALINALAQRAKALGAVDVVPAYHSLLVVCGNGESAKPPAFYIEQLSDYLPSAYDSVHEQPPARHVRIPVCYDAEFAPDLERVAQQHQLSPEAVIDKHLQSTYTVCCLGFIPGFAFMGYVDDDIATPRLDNPRPLVTRGSVGIAGKQTGIYPIDSAGGWNIIGRSPQTLYAPDKQLISCFDIGDSVSFYRISREAFDDWQQ